MLFRLIPGIAFVIVLCGIALAVLSVQHKPALNFYGAVKCNHWRYMGCLLARKPRSIKPGGSSAQATTGSVFDRPSQLATFSPETYPLDLDKKATFRARHRVRSSYDEYRNPVGRARFWFSRHGDRGTCIRPC